MNVLQMYIDILKYYDKILNFVTLKLRLPNFNGVF